MVTIQQIKEATGGYYFSPDTMKCFGQTLSDFRVVEERDRVFIWAPSNKLFGEPMARTEYSIREFKDGDLIPVRPDDTEAWEILPACTHKMREV